MGYVRKDHYGNRRRRIDRKRALQIDCRTQAEACLIILDIYENTTYDIQNELKVKFPDLDLVVLDRSVRNTNRMN